RRPQGPPQRIFDGCLLPGSSTSAAASSRFGQLPLPILLVLQVLEPLLRRGAAAVVARGRLERRSRRVVLLHLGEAVAEQKVRRIGPVEAAASDPAARGLRALLPPSKIGVRLREHHV